MAEHLDMIQILLLVKCNARMRSYRLTLRSVVALNDMNFIDPDSREGPNSRRYSMQFCSVVTNNHTSRFSMKP